VIGHKRVYSVKFVDNKFKRPPEIIRHEWHSPCGLYLASVDLPKPFVDRQWADEYNIKITYNDPSRQGALSPFRFLPVTFTPSKYRTKVYGDGWIPINMKSLTGQKDPISGSDHVMPIPVVDGVEWLRGGEDW